jgi:putative FmdB family regulatory protein
MPIYEYRCSACGHEFEVMQKMSDGPIRKCEACGRLKVKRLVSQSSFVLKGSGWYVTDYAGKKGQGRSLRRDAGENDTKSDTKADAKADTKADTGTRKTESPSSETPDKPPAKAAGV